MIQVSSILDAVKQHGFISVLVCGMFLYFYDRMNTIEHKYEECMNARITDLYRGRISQAPPKTEPFTQPYAVLVEPVKVKRKNQ